MAAILDMAAILERMSYKGRKIQFHEMFHEIQGFDHRVGHLWPLSMTAEFSNAPTSRAEVRVPRTDAAGMADAMIDALFPIRSGASVLGLPTLAWASLVQT